MDRSTKTYLIWLQKFGTSTRSHLITCAIITMLFFVFSDQSNSNGKVVKIAYQLPLSGDLSDNNVKALERGIVLAFDQLKIPLEEKGFTVILEKFDDQGNADSGVANAKRIASDQSIIAVVGHYTNGVQIPSSEVYHTAGLLNISPANTHPRVTERRYEEINRVIGRSDVEAFVLANFISGMGRGKKAFIVHDDIGMGYEKANLVKEVAANNKIEIVGFQKAAYQGDIKDLCSSIVSGSPDIVLSVGYSRNSASLFGCLRRKGYKGILLGDSEGNVQDYLSIGGNALSDHAGTFFTEIVAPADFYPTEEAKKFVNSYKANYGIQPENYAAQGYDAVGISLEAVDLASEKNNIPSRQEVVKAAREIRNYKGVTGTISFDEKGDPENMIYFIKKLNNHPEIVSFTPDYIKQPQTCNYCCDNKLTCCNNCK